MERVRNDSAVIAGLSSELQQAYQIIADLADSLNRNTIDLSQEPELQRTIEIKARDVSSVGGRLERLVQNVAKEKLLDARSKLRMSADNNTLKMQKMQMETHRHQTDLELKKMKRAFTLLQHQNSQLQASIIASQKGPEISHKAVSRPSSRSISITKMADILQHTKGVLDRLVRDQNPKQIMKMVEQSFAIMLGCQATIFITISPDLSSFQGEVGETPIGFSLSHRCISKILKGAERMFIYNDSLSDPSFTKSMSQLLHLSISNLLVFPINNPFKKKIDGFLLFLNKSEQQRHGKIPAPFGRPDQPLLELCAQLAATSLQVINKSARLKEQQYQKKQGLLMLDSLYQNFSFGAFVKNVQENCAKFFRSQRATFLVCDQIRKQLYRRIPHKNDNDSLATFGCDVGISGFVASSGTPFVGAAIENDSRFLPKVDDPNGVTGTSPAKDILAVPIIMESQADLKVGKFDDLPKGILVLINKLDGAPFTQEDNDYVCSYAPLIGRTLDVVQKFQKFLSLGDLFSNLNSQMRELSSGLDQSVNYYQTLRRNYQSIADLFGTMNQPDRNPLIRLNKND